jgi:putative transposase
MGGIMERKVLDLRGHAHFITFSCYKRRRLLDDDRAKGIVAHFLADGLRKIDGACMGFMIMPDHVHALLFFNQSGMLSRFIQQWKRMLSIRLKEFLKNHLPSYAATIDPRDPIWQARYYDFNVFTGQKAREKPEYMHNNPVRKGLVPHAEEWRYGSAMWYILKRPVGVQIATWSKPLAVRAWITRYPGHPKEHFGRNLTVES